jgi:hypothetical protein
MQISPFTNYIQSFSETRVDMANHTPEASPVGEVTVISKSGTNKLHGSIFDYHVTPMFRARPVLVRAPRTGPAARWVDRSSSRTYTLAVTRPSFCASYETSPDSSQQLLNPTVPLDAGAQGRLLVPAAGYDDQGSLYREPVSGGHHSGLAIEPGVPQDPGSFYPILISEILRCFQPTIEKSPPSFRAQPLLDRAYRPPFPPEELHLRAAYLATAEHQFRFEFKSSGPGPHLGSAQHTPVFDFLDQTLGSQSLNELRYGYAFTNKPHWGSQNGLDLVNNTSTTPGPSRNTRISVT